MRDFVFEAAVVALRSTDNHRLIRAQGTTDGSYRAAAVQEGRSTSASYSSRRELVHPSPPPSMW